LENSTAWTDLDGNELEYSEFLGGNLFNENTEDVTIFGPGSEEDLDRQLEAAEWQPALSTSM